MNGYFVSKAKWEIHLKALRYVPGPWGFYTLRFETHGNRSWTESGILKSNDEVEQLEAAIRHRMRGLLAPHTWPKKPDPVEIEPPQIDPPNPPFNGVQTFSRRGETHLQYRFEDGRRVEARTAPPWWSDAEDQRR